MTKYTKGVLLGAALGLAPVAASADAVAVALSASFAPPVAETVTLDVVAGGTVAGQTISIIGETGSASVGSVFGQPVGSHDHDVNLEAETANTDVTVTGTATGVIHTGQGPLMSLSVAASTGDSAAATAASTQGATTASSAATSYGNRLALETDFDGRSDAYESEILIRPGYYYY
ncbi:hypothetical protein ORIO_20600 (plasmid) [Cereibacter azotoformans]|nr:hypothetical protein [Cereibacter azotoformans]ULB12201.1 hypothetical protein ORIO_20600 [Cereibacter azotoformans]